MTSIQCVVQFCKLSVLNKPPGVTFHTCPTSTEMRNKWLHALRNKCVLLDWTKSKICSKHFESKCFDSLKRLKENAVPTIFTSTVIKKPIEKTYTSRSRIDRALSRMTQTEIMNNIKQSMKKLREPTNLDIMVTDELKFKVEVATEAQLWLIIKKQEHLNSRLLEQQAQNKKHIELLQNTIQQNKCKKDVDKSGETHKYIVKCLQEKLATYEEQIEILTAVESR